MQVRLGSTTLSVYDSLTEIQGYGRIKKLKQSSSIYQASVEKLKQSSRYVSDMIMDILLYSA